MSTRRTQPGGWVKRERQPCRWCGGEVHGRRVTFCSDSCVHQWKLRTNPAYLREQVFARDRGVCAVCRLDTEALRKDKRKLDYRARKQFEKDWGGRRHLWDADHIVPVVEGGGECDLSNMRTLCLKCHREATAALRSRRVKRSAGPRDATTASETTMQAKKAKKSRTQLGHGRKSAGETQGHYERDPKRRQGQYGGAGDPPLMKK